MTNLGPTPRELGSARILHQYQNAGAGFDGIDQMLLPHLRENRHTRPRPEDDKNPLSEAVAGLGFSDFQVPELFRPTFVIDDTVLLSYARLDNKTVGAALIDAVADPACQVVVSSLAYLHVLPLLQTIEGGDQRVYRLLRHLERDRQPGDHSPVRVPSVPFRQVEIIGRLHTGERIDVVHTALLALQDRCVLGTLQPGVYHRLGYPRTLDLSA